jgi:hypothetical protein
MTNPENKAGRHKAIRSTGRSRARSLTALLAAEGEDSAELERRTKVICGERASPAGLEQAKKIAKAELIISRINEIHGLVRSGLAPASTEELQRWERRALSRKKTAVRKFLTAQTPLTSANPDPELTEDWGGCSEDSFTDLCDDSTR